MPNQHASITKPCENCGADFLSRIRRPGKYCSLACSSGAARVEGKFKGEKNPRWLGGVAQEHYRYKKRFAAKNPEKVRAHKMVAYAKQTGKLIPQPCEECGAAKAHAHHEDYSRPLDVRWICQLCHNRHHHLGVERRGAPALPEPLSSWQVLADGRVSPLGRRPRGQRRAPTAIDRARGRRVLDADQVRAIRRRLAAGERPREVAKDFPVGEATIGSIGRGDSWKGVGL